METSSLAFGFTQNDTSTSEVVNLLMGHWDLTENKTFTP